MVSVCEYNYSYMFTHFVCVVGFELADVWGVPAAVVERARVLAKQIRQQNRVCLFIS
jgi:hypothetical protein